MKNKILFLTVLTLLSSLLLSACGGNPITASSWPGVSAGEDAVYVAYQTGVFAVKTADGTQLWRYPEKADGARTFYAAPLVLTDQVIVGDYAGNLVSLNKATGTERWTFKQTKGYWVAAPALAGETILAANADGTLYALDLNGGLRWKFSAKSHLWSQPVNDAEKVYQASMDHYLYALKLTDGSKAWEADLGASAVGSPLLDNNVVYIGTLNNELLALDATSGQVKWRLATQKSVWARPVVKDGLLIVADESGMIYGVAADSGAEKWKLDAGSPVVASVGLFSDGFVAVTEKGEVIKGSFTGQKLWPRTMTGKIYSNPVVAGDQMILAMVPGDKLLVSMDTNGNEKWSFVLPK